MKQNIIAAAVFFVICLNHAKAQDSLKVSSLILRKFEREFSDTSTVEWTKLNEAFVAKFQHLDNIWLAYFDEQGEKLTSGRKVKSFYQLPIQVQEGVLQEKSKLQRKFGAIEPGYALEMIEQGTTRYFIPMENERIALIIGADHVGNTLIARKTIKYTPAKPERDLIAKNK